jgi:hypothetical protein
MVAAMSNPFALRDVWLAAVNALPDMRPVAALLRSDTPIPDSVRYLMAELLHPGTPPFTDMQLRAHVNPEFDRMIRKLSATATYRKALAEGIPAREAAEVAGAQANVTARQAFRWIEENVPVRLRNRLHEHPRRQLTFSGSHYVSKEPRGSMVDIESANNLIAGAMSAPG